ncbi:MAG: BON domain-containing protein, partial [Coleofasciculus sp. C2-GNP5-27]
SGVVTLRGTVDAYWKKYQAEQDAYGIAGVIDVINELGVVLTDKPLDQVIARDIEAALARNSHVNVEDITVAVDNGTVILRGNIPNWAAWRSAYNAAIYTTGVIDVVDQLNIVYS